MYFRWLIMALVLFPPGGYAYKLKCPSAPIPPIDSVSYDHDRFGTRPQEVVFEHAGYMSSFDGSEDDDGILAQPQWVSYEMRRFDPNGDGNYQAPRPSIKRPTWYTSEDIRFVFDQPGISTGSLDRSYSGIGSTWNRGHLAMAAHVNRLGWRQACNTHHLYNSIPQFHTLNQGDWLDLEAYTGAVANRYGRVWIIAGPIFHANQPVNYIGDHGEVPIPIPDAVFKIIIKEPQNPDSRFPDVLAFVYENSDQPDYVKCSGRPDGFEYNHLDNLTSIAAIEQVTGLSFLNNLYFKKSGSLSAAEVRDAFKHEISATLWPVSDTDYGVKCGGGH